MKTYVSLQGQLKKKCCFQTLFGPNLFALRRIDFALVGLLIRLLRLQALLLAERGEEQRASAGR